MRAGDHVQGNGCVRGGLPCSTTSAGTPTKRVRFNSAGSGGLSARRQLWTRLQHESVTPILKTKSSAAKEK
ncbi:hypothetical protein HPB48_010004 [Haemaphysalis longicornis]|uniref:Uncharacterized protein n=1 Tax=Haemaphysalis longicornis TaxID=44386 RepID=A0A9J6G960_HAELO|nr:hypothetical protein HPB48_010004 [Haemaphysalis longicornis]